WLGVAPAMRKAESLKRRIEAAHGTIVRSNTRAQDIRGLADTLAHAREFSLVHTKELVEGDISVLMHDISGFLTTLHVTSHEMKQDRSEERHGVLVTPVTLTMRAAFPDLTRLLA